MVFCPKFSFPQRVGKNSYELSSRFCLLGEKATSERRSNTQDAHKIGSHKNALDPLGLPRTRHVHMIATVERSQPLKIATVQFPIRVVRVRHYVIVYPWPIFCRPHQPIGIAVRKLP